MKKTLVALAALAAATPAYAVSVVSLHAGVINFDTAPVSIAGLLALAGVVAWRYARRRTG